MTKRLPGILGRIEAVCGLDVARAVWRAYGGRAVYLPNHPERCPDSAFVRLVGIDNAVRLRAEIGYGDIGVPAGSQSPVRLTHSWLGRLIEALDAEGLSASQISAELGCTIRTVTNHRRRRRERQGG